MLCSVVLLAPVEHHESAPSVRTRPPCGAPCPLGRHGVQAGLSVFHSGFPSALFYTWSCMYVGATYSIHPTLSLSPCPQIRSLHLHLCFFPANGFICTIFLFIDPIKMC